ncbi:MAG: diguanylate cyclase [Eubacteriales bacterium]|nr:diguanylate cyclase [Eubacteriales bacterium]MDZ4042300.1 diguanylate cyclase [Eubacteriales bacterium]MDZ7609846.1 diguanylate cyclase [Eubacteriales bacterium]
MDIGPWIKELPVSITVCDVNGVILEMNEKSCEVFAKDGGRNLIGTNLLDCHPGPARAKLEEMLHTWSSNTYSIEKNGKKQFIYQSPWYQDNEFRGFVEFIMDIPVEASHFVRK